MTNLLPFLKELLSSPGLSGYEKSICTMIEAAWMPLADELSTSRLGSLHGLKQGTAAEPRPRILIATHMDAIGLMVSSIVDGFLRVTDIGGIDHRVLPGQLVHVHGRETLDGVIVQPPAHLLPKEAKNGPVPLQYLLIDTGLPPKETKQLVRPGDLVSFAQEPLELREKTLSGPSLDNRAAVAALTDCLEKLQNRHHAWDIWAVATVQEEETFAGALTSTYQLRPDLAVAIDVTWAKGPGSPDYKTFPLGKGVTLGWGPNIHPDLYRTFKELADELEIPYHTEVMPRFSGTDALAMQVVAAGVPTMVVGIPLRYMHTPVEVVALKDIARAGRLLADFIVRLKPDFMDSLSGDDK
jgi:endoglucanase